MRLLVDESFPPAAVRPLVGAGHDVLSVARCLPGASPARVLELARRRRRILLTVDPGYAPLVYEHGHRPPFAIIYLAFAPVTPDEPTACLTAFFARYAWARRYSTVGRAAVQQRALPQGTRCRTRRNGKRAA